MASVRLACCRAIVCGHPEACCSAPGRARRVIVQLVAKAGSIPYAFEPASITAQYGGTLRFIEDAAMIHNVRFTSHPSGSKLGAATTGPYLTTKRQRYDLLIECRFTEGHHDFVCDPHALSANMSETPIVPEFSVAPSRHRARRLPGDHRRASRKGSLGIHVGKHDGFRPNAVPVVMGETGGIVGCRRTSRWTLEA
jgi:plastocyanin